MEKVGKTWGSSKEDCVPWGKFWNLKESYLFFLYRNEKKSWYNLDSALSKKLTSSVSSNGGQHVHMQCIMETSVKSILLFSKGSLITWSDIDTPYTRGWGQGIPHTIPERVDMLHILGTLRHHVLNVNATDVYLRRKADMNLMYDTGKAGLD